MTHYTPKPFFADRMLYTARLLSVTSAYCKDLTEEDFMHLKIVFPIADLGIQRGERLNGTAAKIVEAFGTDFQTFGSINDETRRIADIAIGFDFDLFGEIKIGGFLRGENGGYTIADGNHRSIAFAVLLHSGQVAYRPVTAILSITKDITEEIIYEEVFTRHD